MQTKEIEPREGELEKARRREHATDARFPFSALLLFWVEGRKDVIFVQRLSDIVTTLWTVTFYPVVVGP